MIYTSAALMLMTTTTMDSAMRLNLLSERVQTTKIRMAMDKRSSRIHRPILGDLMIEAYFHELWWLLGALFFGVMLGSLTGLIPGFHVNNVALILLALSPGLLELGIPSRPSPPSLYRQALFTHS